MCPLKKYLVSIQDTTYISSERRQNMDRVSPQEAAQIKGCSDQAVLDAIKAEKIDAERFSRVWLIKSNRKFQQWTPGEKHQAAGKARWSGSTTPKDKPPKKTRRTA